MAYDGDFYGAIKKLNELPESFLDSEELITLFENDIDSSFIGTWHCGRANSCNDMDITLKYIRYIGLEKLSYTLKEI